MIHVNALNHSFRIGKKDNSKAIPVLKDVDFFIAEKEIISIVGRSGSGKSTLLQILAGFMKPTSGHVEINDQDITSLNEKNLALFRLNHVGFVFQNFQLIPSQNVFENIELPLVLLGLDKKERIQRVEEILQTVGLTDYAKHYPNELSGGQQQRVSIARALINQPKIIFADEPTGSLDSETEKDILAFIQKLNQEAGITFVIITHDEEVAKIGHRKFKMHDGKLMEEGQSHEI